MTDQMEEGATPSWRSRFGDLGKWVHRARNVETAFLSLLRITALVMASIILLVSALALGWGLSQQIGRTHVDPEKVSLSADDLAPAANQTAQAQTEAEPAKAKLPLAMRKRTLDIYRSAFKSYERSGTKMTDSELIDYIWTQDQLHTFNDLGGKGLHKRDGAPLNTPEELMGDALDLVEVAAKTPPFTKPLAAYHNAKMVNVCTDQVVNESRLVTSWDSFSTNCSNWYNSPIGCSTTRMVNEPVARKQCTMQFPGNLSAPAQQYAEALQRYAETAKARLETAVSKARDQTENNAQRKAGGLETIGTSGKLFLGFLSVMFLYLFVAMERHHRHLRALVANKD